MADAETLESLGRLVDIMARLRAPGRLSVGPRADAREPAPVPRRGGLRGARRDRRRRPRRRCATSSATCCCRSSSTPRSRPRAAASASPTSRAPSPTSSCAAIRTSSATSRCATPTRSCATGGASRRRSGAPRRRRPAGAARGRARRACPPSPARSRSARSSRTSGFDWPDLAGVLAKLRRGARRARERAVAAATARPPARELGDLLLTLTSVARHLDVPAEMALRDATGRLVRARRPRRGGGARDRHAARPASTQPSGIACGRKPSATDRRARAPAHDRRGLTRSVGAAW